jgi:hypothetical protein
LTFAIVIPAVLSTGAVRAEEPQVDPLAIPLVVLEADAAVPAGAVEGAVAGIAAPVLRGEGLRRGLSLAGSAVPAAGVAFVARAEEAEDLFYAGDHEAARAVFEGLLAGIEGDPAHLARDPGLRAVAFDARMFLAAIARLRGDEGLVDRLLAVSRERYPELQPGSAFPPWLRERAARAVPGGDANGDSILEVPEGCGLLVDGRESPPDAGGRVRLRGERQAVQARCEGRPGPVAVVTRGAPAARFRPLALEATRLPGDEGEVVLAADAGATDEALVHDLLELARAAGASRLVAVVGAARGVELWLVDAEAGARVRVARVAGPGTDAAAAERAGAELAGAGGSRTAGGPDGSRPWYRDGTAWIVTATGLAAAVTGLVLGQVHGGPSAEEPAAVALMASGAALAATGVVLFLVPAPGDEGGLALGAGAAWSF